MTDIPMPKYRQIADDLLKKIQTGIYPINALIPKEIELATFYGVSRPTIRQAIQLLVNDGYLDRRKKRGTIVRQRKIVQEFTHVIASYDQEMDNHGLIPMTKVIMFTTEVADNEVCERLNLPIDSIVFKLVRLRYANDQPIVIVTTYIPYSVVPHLSDYDFTAVSLYETLAANNTAVVRVQRRLEVIKADETVANLLNVQQNEPLFYFHTIGHTQDSGAIEYSIAKYRGDLNSFNIDVSL
ncbi:GntR family transcriptional regulator [Periweissella beninensis]|uniref:GntR family transcriptional regulator n=1 Tax=Periweissella beninensis TaxID=504936 RepID=A0ABT0VJH5_9LACO|nr:GntR family transcriptional regulator [Periweissella beninensis]MBM7543433.1 GntR family transcriptional regulator [Periweissella beninensis]MCM2437273.1 GntR family transcriptional regulator [Periweissella beninensis]MCT4396100.1 GntR family transcriptional regulator [Periweissella beninensis]